MARKDPFSTRLDDRPRCDGVPAARLGVRRRPRHRRVRMGASTARGESRRIIHATHSRSVHINQHYSHLLVEELTTCCRATATKKPKCPRRARGGAACGAAAAAPRAVQGRRRRAGRAPALRAPLRASPRRDSGPRRGSPSHLSTARRRSRSRSVCVKRGNGPSPSTGRAPKSHRVRFVLSRREEG